MPGIIEKIKNLFKCKAEKKAQSEPQQQEQKSKEKAEEQTCSSEQAGSG